MKSGYVGYIPSYIRHNKDLNPLDKLIYAEITANIELEGYCKKTNTFFMRMLNISRATISRRLTNLREQGCIYIVIEQEKVTNKFINRFITLTLPQIRVGVKHQIDIPHAQIRDGGVSLDGDKTKDNAPSDDQNRGTLLQSNNNIQYIYSNHKNNVIINEAINEKQLHYLKSIVSGFYITQSTNFPEIVKNNWHTDSNLTSGSINVLFDLITIDKWSDSKVRDVLNWIVKDSFWASKCYSLRVLRDQAPNGQRKFTNMYASYVDKMKGRG
tara:strand:+ start:223 stop:1032 length:810 start_codon:yes stop_codon:yes gene_type:complete